MKKFQKSKHRREICSLFGIDGVTKAAQISEAGLLLFAACYGGKIGDSLDHLRHEKYMHMVATSMSNIEPQRLPQTERAAYFHCLRVHNQVRVWKTFDRCLESPEEWGWKIVDHVLTPVMTDKESAPENLLVIIRCKCKLSSKNQCGTNLCSCRKSGLKCAAACEGCRGDDCNNAQEPFVNSDIPARDTDFDNLLL